MGFSLMELFLDNCLTPLVTLSFTNYPCQPPSPTHSVVPIGDHTAFAVLQVLFGCPTTHMPSLPTSHYAYRVTYPDATQETCESSWGHTLIFRTVPSANTLVRWVDENAFASIVQTRPCPTFGRPVHQWDSSLDYGPVLLLKPFRSYLTVGTLPSETIVSASEELPPLLDMALLIRGPEGL